MRSRRRTVAWWATMLALTVAACSSGRGTGTGAGSDGLDGGLADTAEASDSDTEPGPDASAPECEEHADCVAGQSELGSCEAALCDGATGTCFVGAAKDWTPCDDADACTLDDACQDGVCVGAGEKACDDANPCTDDSCASAAGCTFTENTADCDDGDPLSTADTCSGGVCTGLTDPCHGVDCSEVALGACETASCVATSGQGDCVVVPLPDGAPCDDGDPLTDLDACLDAVCVGTPVGGCEPADCEAFDDLDACNGTLKCAEDGGEACVVDPATVVVCDTTGDGPCEATSCDPATGACVTTTLEAGVACDDADPCTTEDVCGTSLPPCDGLGGAEIALHYVVIDGAEIRVGYSKGFDTCGHVLSTANQIQHASNFFCTSGECLEKVVGLDDMTLGLGDAVKICHGNDYGNCSDAVVVTEAPQGCVGTLVTCDDGDPCTADACDGATGDCTHQDTCGAGSATCQLYLGEYKFNDPQLTRMGTDGEGAVALGTVPPEDWLVVGLWVDPVGAAVTWVHGSGPGRIQRRLLEGGPIETLVSGLTNPRGLTVDGAGGWMWWSDTQDRAIYRATTDGDEVLAVVIGDDQLGRPTFDPVTGDLWYGNLGAGTIHRIGPDGAGDVTVVTDHTDDPIAIAVDHALGKVYWADVQTTTNHIARANLDGSDAEVVFAGGAASSGLTGLAVDGAAGAIWWADEIGAGDKGVWRAGLLGEAPSLIYASPEGYNAGVLFASPVGCAE